MLSNTDSESGGDMAGCPPCQSGTQGLEEFIYLVSHDLRNSVRAIVEIPKWIREDIDDLGCPINGSLAENMHMMETHTRRLDVMLEDLLIYSRVGRMQAVVTVDLCAAVRQVIADINVPQGFGITVDIQAPSLDIGERDIVTLLHALISNAIKHHDRDAGAITVASFKRQGGLVLSVTDDGPGIPTKYRERIFEMMTTLKPRDEIEGSGIGLALVRKIANTLNAEILWPQMDSEHGTCLEICFPTR